MSGEVSPVRICVTQSNKRSGKMTREQGYLKLPSGCEVRCEEQGARMRGLKNLGNKLRLKGVENTFFPINAKAQTGPVELSIQLGGIFEALKKAGLEEKFGGRLLAAAKNGNAKECTNVLLEVDAAFIAKERDELFSPGRVNNDEIDLTGSLYGEFGNAEMKLRWLAKNNSYLANTEPLNAPEVDDGFNGSYNTTTFELVNSTKERGGEDHAFTIQSEKVGVFQAVFDGHNDQGEIGRRAQEFFQNALKGWDKDSDQSVEGFLEAKVAEFELELWDAFNDPARSEKWLKGGAAFVASWVPPGSKTAYVMSLGDCQGFLFRGNEMYPLSPDGDWRNEESRDRLKSYLQKVNKPGSAGEDCYKLMMKAIDDEKSPTWPNRTIKKSVGTSGSVGDFCSKYGPQDEEKFGQWLERLTIGTDDDDIRRAYASPTDPKGPGVVQMINSTPFIVPVQLQPGDSLVLVSDGVTDPINAADLKQLKAGKSAEDFVNAVKRIAHPEESNKPQEEKAKNYQDDIGIAISTFSDPGEVRE